MTKKVRIVLYTISSVLAAAVLVLLIFHGKILKPASTPDDGAQINTETTESGEASAADGTEEMQENEETAGTQSGSPQDAASGRESATIVFAGDVLIAAAMENYYDTEGVTRLVSEELLAEMQNADICMVNNEFQFSTRGTPMEDKQYTFQTDPKYVQILLDMGVDIVSLANNHTIDFGLEALQDTFATLDDAGILYAGAGETRERAKELQIIEVNGMKFGFLAATRVIPVAEWNVDIRQPGLFATYDDTRLVECIELAQEECDFLAVYVHWGLEREAYPQEYQRVIARHCFEAGADLVIGAHPHVLQGIEFMEGKPVFYSLGNYVFSQTISRTALVKAEVWPDGEVSYSLIPAYAAEGKTQMFEGEDAQALFDYMNEISTQDYVDKDGSIKEVK